MSVYGGGENQGVIEIWGDKASLRITLVSLWHKLGAIAQPGAQISGHKQIKEKGPILSSFAVAHWPFAFLACPRLQEAEK